MKAIIFALIASLGYGICTPIVKVAFKKGMLADGFAIAYAFGLILVSLPTINKNGFHEIFPNQTTLWLGLIAGTICALAVKAQSESLSIETSLVAVISLVVATFPLVSSSISLSFMGESEKVIVPKLVIGGILIIVGGYLATTSIITPK